METKQHDPTTVRSLVLKLRLDAALKGHPIAQCGHKATGKLLTPTNAAVPVCLTCGVLA